MDDQRHRHRRTMIMMIVKGNEDGALSRIHKTPSPIPFHSSIPFLPSCLPSKKTQKSLQKMRNPGKQCQKKESIRRISSYAKRKLGNAILRGLDETALQKDWKEGGALKDGHCHCRRREVEDMVPPCFGWTFGLG